MLDDNGRPRYGRAYADQLKQDLADEMERRRLENEHRMRKLREQFKDQNKQIEEASSGAPPPWLSARPLFRPPALVLSLRQSVVALRSTLGGVAGCRS